MYFTSLPSVLGNFINAAQLPEATIAPSIQTVEVGHSATFSCTTARAISTTEWRRNNVPISNDPDHSINDSGNTLTVTNAQGGNYTCVAENDAGSVSSNTAVLQLAGKLPRKGEGGGGGG